MLPICFACLLSAAAGQIAARDVGPMKKIRVGHDNSGAGPAWHLNRVEVTNLKTGEHRIFPANKWFSKKDDDFQVRTGRVYCCCAHLPRCMPS